MCKKPIQSKRIMFMVFSLFVVASLGQIAPTIAQSRPLLLNGVQLDEIQVFPGQPDLTVTAQNTRPIFTPNGEPRDSSLVTISVQNRLTASQSLPARFFGSEARGILVSVAIPAPLSQVGMTIPSGFTCGVASGNHNILCWGGTIAAGGSVDFLIEVISEDLAGGFVIVNVQAEVDPYSWIAEVSETNNKASTGVLVANIP
jgi:hypothetical protein